MLLLLIFAALAGLAIGSFLNVVIWRVPRGESIVRPPSACPKCGNQIRERDNVPVLGWLLLRGKCRDCSEPISVRYPLVEAGTGALFAVMAWRFGFQLVLVAYLYLAAISVALALIDIDVKRLPNAITLPSYPVALLLLGAAALVDGNEKALIRAVVGGVIAFAFYALLVVVYPAGMGLGDVKLSGVLGMYLGWVSYGVVATGLFLGFFFGGVVSIGLVTLSSAGRKTKIPFGPYMLLGTLVAVLFGQDLVDAYVSVALG